MDFHSLSGKPLKIVTLENYMFIAITFKWEDIAWKIKWSGVFMCCLLFSLSVVDTFS